MLGRPMEQEAGAGTDSKPAFIITALSPPFTNIDGITQPGIDFLLLCMHIHRLFAFLEERVFSLKSWYVKSFASVVSDHMMLVLRPTMAF